jgi:peptide/nickel transport system substrate-binding protein
MADHGFSRRALLQRGAAAGGVLLGGSWLAACGGDDEAAPPAAATTGGETAEAAPKEGGILRIGVAGGGTNDQIEVGKSTNAADYGRARALYEPLFSYDSDYTLVPWLAEEATPNDTADEWTVRLREGVEFHNGKTVTVDDLIFSIQHQLDPEIGFSNMAVLFSIAGLDFENGVTKLDERTVRFALNAPCSIFRDLFTSPFVVPVDYDPAAPVGTGAFKYESFTPGEQSIFPAHAGYWGEGPYVDELHIINLSDDTARVNALLAGQVDAINALPYGQVPVIEGNDDFAVLISESGLWRPFTMRVDQPPFDDERVRRAFRLIVDRQQMIEQALAGHGRIGNDLYSPQDACYASAFPQRDQDIEQAKSLLAQAGHTNLEVELVTSPVQGGVVEMSEVFVQQARAAGVTVSLRRVDPGTFYGENYLSWTFSVDWAITAPYLVNVSWFDGPAGIWNETHFSDPEFNDLYQQALRTVDDAQRCEIAQSMQEIQHERGGYIIPYFPNTVDAYSAQLLGLEPHASGEDLGGWRLEKVSFA